MSNESKQTNGKKRVDAHFTGRLLHDYENISNLVPSLQHSLLLWSLLLRSHLVVRGNDNWQTGSDPHLRDVSEGNRRIHQMLRCRRSDLGYHRPSRLSTGRAKVTVATSRFLFISTEYRRQDKFEKGLVADRRTNQNQGPAVTRNLGEQISRKWKSHFPGFRYCDVSTVTLARPVLGLLGRW